MSASSFELATGPFTPFGRAHPAVLRAARVIMEAGWRVSSIVRHDHPLFRGPSHAKGIALDAVPLVGGEGGFGPRTASMLLQLLTSRIPGYNWWVVGETDHFHIQLTSGPSRVGILTRSGIQWF